ncbi:MAG: hypothetical protein PF961_09740 [Planctomycetota bacterium]|jgi:hypothetical protein|nr:hypothetical protein [Planctomycetota bacterium]
MLRALGLILCLLIPLAAVDLLNPEQVTADTSIGVLLATTGSAAIPEEVDERALKRLYPDWWGARGDARGLAAKQLLAEGLRSKRDEQRYGLLAQSLSLAADARQLGACLDAATALAKHFDRDAVLDLLRSELPSLRDPGAQALALLDDPLNPTANGVVGSHLALSERRYAEAAVYWLLCDDPALVALAEADTGTDALAAAEAWDRYGEDIRKRDERAVAWARALEAYQHAIPDLDGARLRQAEDRRLTLLGAVPASWVDLEWDAITAEEWDALRATTVSVAAKTKPTDCRIRLAEGQQLRVVPHPSDTWTWEGRYWQTAHTVTWRGQRTLLSMGGPHALGELTVLLSKDGPRQSVGLVTGPAQVHLAPFISYDEAVGKGTIRAKLIPVE